MSSQGHTQLSTRRDGFFSIELYVLTVSLHYFKKLLELVFYNQLSVTVQLVNVMHQCRKFKTQLIKQLHLHAPLKNMVMFFVYR